MPTAGSRPEQIASAGKMSTLGKQKWFVVKTPDEAAREGVNIRETLPRAKQIQFDGIKGDFQRLIEQWQKEQKMLSDKVEKCENTGWWNKTRWREHLKNCNLIHLSYASRLPDKDEEGLLKVAAVIKKMVERGVLGLNSMLEGLRRWLRSAEMHKPDVRPLARLQNSESQERAMIHFMAVIGIDETNARLRDGNDYSYIIAGLVYVSRLVAAEALLPSLEREN
ncbi:hypothetical protein D6D12_10739 [Aureobasidium pullulans]|uniref:Uncharacterized protein n=1 Tax=Aureobasidium pullulans TaxID=5580 RepID=A0AB74JDE5_AURPU|nr:hypothetical protein D6D12_10739 [Aureobasidium pullulans]